MPKSHILLLCSLISLSLSAMTPENVSLTQTMAGSASAALASTVVVGSIGAGALLGKAIEDHHERLGRYAEKVESFCNQIPAFLEKHCPPAKRGLDRVNRFLENYQDGNFMALFALPMLGTSIWVLTRIPNMPYNLIPMKATVFTGIMAGLMSYATVRGYQWDYARLKRLEKQYTPEVVSPAVILNKQALSEQIKADITRILYQEMGIISKDWLAMAQGNQELATDLYELYRLFNTGDRTESQKQLDALCKKWELEPIVI